MITFMFPVGHMQKGQPWFFKLQAIWSRRALRRLQDSSFLCLHCMYSTMFMCFRGDRAVTSWGAPCLMKCMTG